MKSSQKKSAKASPGHDFQNKKRKEVERLAGDQVKVWMKSALGKLQGEYRTDVLKFWNRKAEGKWDEIFTESDITYEVNIQGLTTSGQATEKNSSRAKKCPAAFY
ncbi:hypothetical protein CHCC20347_4037 [Bacillus paralicheniformis]|nr:Ger(x)C family spore germination C-terminal domain-containing protein [Bacillus paralicheniformis]TWK38778.1 hypothetical protein CHCC20347_4037 [Bacillus paralicheniformis]